MKTIKVKRDFSQTPGPRYIDEGEFSGELFRKDFLFKEVSDAISQNYKLLIDLDGTAGYGTSFLEETFGGLIRENGLKYEDIVSHIEIKSVDEDYLIEDIQQYLKDARDGKKI